MTSPCSQMPKFLAFLSGLQPITLPSMLARVPCFLTPASTCLTTSSVSFRFSWVITSQILAIKKKQPEFTKGGPHCLAPRPSNSRVGVLLFLREHQGCAVDLRLFSKEKKVRTTRLTRIIFLHLRETERMFGLTIACSQAFHSLHQSLQACGSLDHSSPCHDTRPHGHQRPPHERR